MIVHESHPIAMPVDARHAAAEGGRQVVYGGEQPLASAVRFRCPHKRSIQFRLGQYGGSQSTVIGSACAASQACTS